MVGLDGIFLWILMSYKTLFFFFFAKPWKMGRVLTNGDVEDTIFQEWVITGEDAWGRENMRCLFLQRL